MLMNYKKLQKTAVFSGLSLMLASSLVACSSQATPGSTSTNGSDKPVEIVYWHMWTSDWKKLIDSLVDEFNKTHPNIHVKALSITGDAETKFLTADAGGDPPDVFTEWNQVIPSWAQKGVIQPLDQFSDADQMKNWMYPIVEKIGDYQGKMYAVPFSMNTFMMFYNKDILQQEGFDPEKPPQTTDELDAMQDKLWKFDSRGYITRVGFMPSWLTQWSTAFGGQWADDQGNPTATNENNLRTLEWFQKYAMKYDATKVAAWNKSMSSNVNSAWPFLSGKQVFAVDGMWRLIDLKNYAPNLHYGVEPLPHPQGGKENASWVNGNYNIIPTKAKHPKEAWEFIKWLTGYGNEKWASEMLPKGGWIPVSPKITEQPAYQQFMQEIPVRKQFVDLMSSPNVQITPVIPVQQYYWDRAGAAEEAVMNKKKTPEQALKDLQNEVMAELKKVSNK